MSGEAATVNHLAFLNANATNARGNNQRLLDINQALAEPGSTYRAVYEPARPAHVQEHTAGLALVSSDGGEGTTRAAIGAILGIIADDPEQTAAHYDLHREIVNNVRFFAAAGGNANNWPLSAHGRYARQPARMRHGWPHNQTDHYPLYYMVNDEQGRTVHSNIAISGLGFGGSAVAADHLNAAKPELKQLSSLRRLQQEAVLSGSAAVQVPAFSARLQFSSEYHTEALQLSQVAGLEFIKSRIYAKRGRTGVNVDDTCWQREVIPAGNRLSRPLHIANAMLRLATGRQPLELNDFSKLTLKLQVDRPVQFHADGETDASHILTPDQTLTARLVRLPVRTYINTGP